MRKRIHATTVLVFAMVLTGCYLSRPKESPPPTAGPIQGTITQGSFDITYDIPKNCTASGESLPITVSVQGRTSITTITDFRIEVTNGIYTKSLIPSNINPPQSLTMDDPPFVISTTWDQEDYRPSPEFYGVFIRAVIQYVEWNG